MNSCETIAALDVGNSAIKVAVATATDRLCLVTEGGSEGASTPQRTFSLDQSGWEQRIRDWVQRQTGNASVTWWVSTVNRAASRSLHEALSPREEHWRTLSFKDIPIRTEVDFPEKVGIDRLLSAYAASSRFSGPLVVVDAGSAVTVDYVRIRVPGQPIFAGGAILPGIRLQHAALATGTEGLQQAVQSMAPQRVAQMGPATNTEQAIRLGVIAAVVGAVERLAHEYAREQAPAETTGNQQAPVAQRIVITGGDAPLISRYLREKHDLIPNLVCQGILELAFQQCQIASSGLK